MEKKTIFEIPFGLRNTGAICHFNALLQSLMRCSFIYDYIDSSITINKFFIEMVAHRDGSKSSDMIELLKEYITSCMVKGKERLFSGQQSSDEGFIYLTEMMKIQKLFEYKYDIKHQCLLCGHEWKAVDSGVIINMFNIQLMNEYKEGKIKPIEFKKKFRDYIYGYDEIMFEFKCEKCSGKMVKKSYELKFMNKYLIVMINKYDEKNNVPCPTTLEFPSTDGTAKYKLVSMIEHSGTQSGGHYIAYVNYDKYFICNDESISTSDIFIPDENTFILFYESTDAK
jgi:ubiquitin C-terminal hydrolase